ncbi:MAG: STAS domain-containing protein [Magnetococcales bacterium]|nr:STAS domain-containing protein [Magnetococcales bacterium]
MFEFNADDSGQCGTLVLAGDLTIQHAQPLRHALLEATSQVGQQLSLKMGQVARVDLTGLQILCAAHRDILKKGKKLLLVDQVSESWQNAVVAAAFQNCVNNDDCKLWKGKD